MKRGWIILLMGVLASACSVLKEERAKDLSGPCREEQRYDPLSKTTMRRVVGDCSPEERQRLSRAPLNDLLGVAKAVVLAPLLLPGAIIAGIANNRAAGRARAEKDHAYEALSPGAQAAFLNEREEAGGSPYRYRLDREGVLQGYLVGVSTTSTALDEGRQRRFLDAALRFKLPSEGGKGPAKLEHVALLQNGPALRRELWFISAPGRDLGVYTLTLERDPAPSAKDQSYTRLTLRRWAENTGRNWENQGVLGPDQFWQEFGDRRIYYQIGDRTAFIPAE